ncbi:MAG: 50S ribosomal protein L18 [Bdellovibrionales bacterium]|nr:50S ribosomal protein L18 [Bdellovibrionales bacterium]
MAIKPKKEKISARLRRKYRIRKRLSGTGERPRLSVYRSGKFTYAQMISDLTGETLASASTRDKEVLDAIGGLDKEGAHSEAASSKSVIAAKALGLVVAQKAKEKNIENVVFDRNGYLYHGRIQAVADGARQGGLQF